MANRFRGGGGVSLKPENSLKRAEELIGVGQKENALQTLHDTITNKRMQRNWTKALEQVMLRYVDLCVEMRAGRKCKDALINYRNSVQSTNVGSLETVVNHLLDAATAKAEAARAQADAGVADDLAKVGDLEAEASPEELALSFVSGEKDADRTDRAVATPWFRFLWECYRTVLDVLRNNARLEALYASSAQRAFAFCRAHQRGAELRRLCDVLRNHLANLLRYRDSGGAHRTDLTKPASWELAVGLRFEALRSACDLALWAEAFRCVEDVQALLALAPRGATRPRAGLMAAFYTRLVLVFGRSGSRLYHAYAWHRLFSFARAQQKPPTALDVQGMATNVVLAALAVEPYDVDAADAAASQAAQGPSPHHQRGGGAAERAQRVAALLGFATPRAGARADGPALSRSALLADVERKGLLALAPAPVRALHAALEGELDPLALCATVEHALAALPGLAPAPSPACPADSLDYERYAQQLREVALLQATRQAGRVYSRMRISSLAALSPSLGLGDVERLVVEGVRAGLLRARFDHANGTVVFGGEQLEDDRLRGHAALLARRLRSALELARTDGAAAAPAQKALARARAEAVARAAAAAAGDNARALARKALIERRKEDAERSAHERERAAEEARAKAEAAQRESEARRVAAERAKRETERIQRELEEAEQAELKAVLAAQGKRAPKDGERLDARAVTAEVVSEQMKAQAELQKRLARVAKTQDHLERARREEEAPLRAKLAAKRAEEDREAAAEDARRAEEARRAAWERDLARRDRLAHLLEDRRRMAEALQRRREAEFEAAREAQRRAREERSSEHRAELDLARRREYVRRCRLEVEEARRVAAEEQARIERERSRKEEEERQRKLEELAERQRRREHELDERQRERAAAPPAAAPAARTGGYVPPNRRGAAAPAAAPGPAPYGAAVPPPRAAAAPYGAPARRDDAYAPPRRDDPAPPRDGPAAPVDNGAAAGKWVPRNRRDGSAAPPPPPARGGSRW